MCSGSTKMTHFQTQFCIKIRESTKILWITKFIHSDHTISLAFYNPSQWNLEVYQKAHFKRIRTTEWQQNNCLHSMSLYTGRRNVALIYLCRFIKQVGTIIQKHPGHTFIHTSMRLHTSEQHVSKQRED